MYSGTEFSLLEEAEYFTEETAMVMIVGSFLPSYKCHPPDQCTVVKSYPAKRPKTPVLRMLDLPHMSLESKRFFQLKHFPVFLE